jgi:tRNA dimethylallyltransferase
VPYPLIAIVGPTGAGKSHLAVALALSFQGEIVNCDSLQQYKGLDVGTAKISSTERRGIPHHLLDILEPVEVSTAGDYAARARPILREILSHQHVPIVVGGTGFYLRALLDGLAEGPQRDDTLRATLVERESRRPGILHRYLRRLDPRTAERIHRNDRNKVIRALEISLLAQRPAAQLFEAGRQSLKGYDPLKIVLEPPRERLREVLGERTRGMFQSGLLEEVAALLAKGTPVTAKSFESIGYKEALQVLAGGMTLAEAIERTTIETRQYAKRQTTWFRRERGAQRIEGFGHENPVLLLAHEIARVYLDKFA